MEGRRRRFRAPFHARREGPLAFRLVCLCWRPDLRRAPFRAGDGGRRQACHREWNGRNKQEEEHELPFLPPLGVSIDAWRAAGEGHLVWLVCEWGAPYASTDTLAALFRQQRRYAGITAGLLPHALRKLAAVPCVDRCVRQYRRQLAEARGARHPLGPRKAPSAEAEITLFAANQK